ncbi:hypothetical protein AAE478_001949 [Parahypoxylon ruwenzoriense]
MATAALPCLQPHLPPPPPPVELFPRGHILFCHPGYEVPTNNVLLSLPRVDLDHTADAAVFGVHYRTALLACQVIAGNAFDTGRLTLDRAGQQGVNVPLDDLYPIVPSFQDWEFPHGRIPDFWPGTPGSITTASHCGITNVSFAIKGAYLVPREERPWYNRNAMSQYGWGLGDIDNAANILPLRRDLHKCFDDRWFAIVPKIFEAGTSVGVTTSSPQYVTHILSNEAAELWPTYHHTIVQSLHNSSRPYLFARFAWAILLRVKPYITAGIPRDVTRVYINNDERKTEYKAERLSGPQLERLYCGGGSKAAISKNATPSKRKRSARGKDNADEISTESSSEDIDDSRNAADNAELKTVVSETIGSQDSREVGSYSD